MFDTNTMVSALLFESSKPAQALFKALHTGSVLSSLATLEELADVLRRPKFDVYVSQEERQSFLSNFILATTLVEVTTKIEACRDAKDNKFLELAVDGTADFIVTGDKDLLDIHPFQGVMIATPAAFLAFSR